jgi:hypothetical protein
MTIPAMTKTKRLIQLLGTDGVNATKRQLTLYELGTLLVVAGNEAGFEARTEYPQRVSALGRTGKPLQGRIDCVWLRKDSNLPIAVAWEIDAQDVGPRHLNEVRRTDGSVKTLGNIQKLRESKAHVKIQALYSIRGGTRPNKRSGVEACVTAHGIRVLSDVDLMQGELLKLVDELFAVTT